MKLLGLVLLLVVLLVAVVVGEAVATVAASEMVVVLVVLQRGTRLRFHHYNLFCFSIPDLSTMYFISLLQGAHDSERLNLWTNFNKSLIPGRSLRCMG